MSIETTQERIMRFEKAGGAIFDHDPNESFSSLIENRSELFEDFKVVYSTNNIESDFSHTSLKYIEEQCPVLKKFFYGSGLLFYSDDLFSQTKIHNSIQIPIDYSLSLDSNAAERFRIWENGGSLDTEKIRFEQLIRFIKEGQNEGFNFDYSFFIIENLENSRNPDNHRPFNTIRALKRFDHLLYNEESFDILNPIFEVDRGVAGLKAIDTIHTFQSSKEILHMIDRRNALYLTLLKAVLLKNKSPDLVHNLNALIVFSMNTLGAFAKTEIYFAWKLFKYGRNLKFFDPINQVNKNSLSKIRGMAWDLFAIRYQETLATRSKIGDFYIPFFASFDNKFVDFAKACPIRAILLDAKDKRISSIFLDEPEFIHDFNAALTANLREQLSNPIQKLKRISNKASSESISSNILKLESEFEVMFK